MIPITYKCPISGQIWGGQGEALSNGKVKILYHIHPLFNMGISELTWIAKRHNRKMLTDNEVRILALAIAGSTGLIHWESPCSDSYPIAIAQRAINEWLELAIWLQDNCRSEQQLKACFPQIVIDSSMASCVWLRDTIPLLRAARNEYFLAYAATRLAARKQENAAIRKRLKNTSKRKPERYFAALSYYITDCLSASIRLGYTIGHSSGQKSTLKQYYQSIIQYAGINTGFTSAPKYPITRTDIETLIDLIAGEFNILEDKEIYLVFKALQNLASSNDYGQFSHIIDDTQKEPEYCQQTYDSYLKANMPAKPDKMNYDRNLYNNYFKACFEWEKLATKIRAQARELAIAALSEGHSNGTPSSVTNSNEGSSNV